MAEEWNLATRVKVRTSGSSLVVGALMLLSLAGCQGGGEAQPPKVDPAKVTEAPQEPLGDRPNVPGNDPR